MKILMILENEFPIDERVEKEALSLIGKGHIVHLACATLQNRPTHENYKGINIHRIKSNTFYYKKARPTCLTTPFYFNFWTKFINTLLLKLDIECIHIHDLPLSKVGIELSKKFDKKLVVDFHENYPDMLNEELYTKTIAGRILAPNHLWAKYEKKVLEQLNNAIVVCDEMKQRIDKISKVDKVAILDNVIDISRWPNYIPKQKTEKVLRLVYVGGMNIKRGLEIAIKGIAIFNETNTIKAELDLFGSGKKDYIKSLLELAEDLGIKEYINHKGYLKLPEDAQEYACYNVGVIPHLKSVQTDNSSPNKLYQYLNYKLPVLCSDCNSLIRVVTDTQGGLLYDNKSPEDFARKLAKFISPSVQVKHGEKGQESIMRKYNWTIAEKNLSSFYNSI